MTDRLKRYSEGRTLASNLVYTIWAVFGGFILHFLLSRYLTVLLKPSYEEPVETAADLVKRNIIPFSWPGSDYYVEMFAEYPDPYYKQIAQRLHITKGTQSLPQLSSWTGKSRPDCSLREDDLCSYLVRDNSKDTLTPSVM